MYFENDLSSIVKKNKQKKHNCLKSCRAQNQWLTIRTRVDTSRGGLSLSAGVEKRGGMAGVISVGSLSHQCLQWHDHSTSPVPRKGGYLSVLIKRFKPGT